MKEREERIAWRMGYCQHYIGSAQSNICRAGCNMRQIQNVQIPGKSLKWGPCIDGHLLADAKSHCVKWERYTREQGEEYASQVERSIMKMTIAMPFISAWRKKEPHGKAEIVECPVCKKRLRLEQSSYNGHVRARCETDNCINFIE